MTAILTTDPLDLSSAPAGVPGALNALIRRCLEKDARERFQSARDLAFALQAVATETRSGATPAATPARNRVVPLVATAVVVTTVAAAGLITWRRPQATTNTPAHRGVDRRTAGCPGGRHTRDRARRAQNRVCGFRRRHCCADLRPIPGYVRHSADRRDGGRGRTVLVARRPVTRLFRARPPVADRCRGQRAAVDCSGLRSTRRHLGTRQPNRLLAAS